MFLNVRFRRLYALFLLLAFAALLSACKDKDAYFSYRPFNGPVVFTIDSSGHIEVSVDSSIVTLLGEFEIGFKHPISADSEDLTLILRNRRRGKDSIYVIRGGKHAKIVVDGRTVILVDSQQVIVDVTDARYVKVVPPEDSLTLTSSTTVICEGAEPSHLSIGMTARVNWPKVNVRSYPRVPEDWDANILTELSQGEEVEVIGGPRCAHGGYWWQVKTPTGIEGWMREAARDKTYLVPDWDYHGPRPDTNTEKSEYGTVLFSEEGPVHVGDEDVEGWAPLTGGCYQPVFSVERVPFHAVLSLEVYGLDVPAEVWINHAGAVELPPQPSSSLQDPPNYWSSPYEIRLPADAISTPTSVLSICAKHLPKERGGDLDDFQMRNIRILAP